MDGFIKALTSARRSESIPDEYDYFGQLIGEWDFEWIDRHGTEQERHVRGEWIFCRVLEGTAIQDVFICPSREERLAHHQPDAEYGTTLRLYNPGTQAWDIFYGCSGQAARLEARREDGEIVLTEINRGMIKWIFSDITQTAFHWRHMSSEDGGATWRMNGELFAIRRK